MKHTESYSRVNKIELESFSCMFMSHFITIEKRRIDSIDSKKMDIIGNLDSVTLLLCVLPFFVMVLSYH